MKSEQSQVAALAAVLRATGFGEGEYRCVIGGTPFPPLPYSTACALYECARRMGRTAALTSELKLIRRSWGLTRGVSP